MFPSAPRPALWDAAVGMGMMGLLEDAGATQKKKNFRGPGQAQGMKGQWGHILRGDFGVLLSGDVPLGCA